MEDRFLDISRRKFSHMPIPGLSNKAREAVNAALDSLSEWRNESAEASEKNGKELINRMAEAAKELGWPDQVVNAVRTQIQSVAAVQINTMDQIMDAWEAQLKLPDPSAAPASALLAKMTSFPANSPSTIGMQMTNPLQLWLQFAAQWQKSWAEAMVVWSKTAKPK